MTCVLDHLAELTALRDHDQLDVTLATALTDLLRPMAVAVIRTVGEGVGQRWVVRAKIEAGDAVPTSDPVWIDTDSLPRLPEFPLRHAALAGRMVVSGPATDAPAGHSVTVFPLLCDQDALGVVELLTETAASPETRRLVASILSVFRNFQSLLAYSERDTLTGLLNRKTFDDSFFKVVHGAPACLESAAERRHQPGQDGGFWLAMLDLDHFKSVNDTYGHLIGDEVLLLMSRIMRSTLRSDDRLYRFGGEEFVIVMRCDADSNARMALERLRRAVEAYVFPRVGQVTLSIGFTRIRLGDTPATALERADLAVYDAKHEGRNRVCSHRDQAIVNLSKAAEHIGEIELF